MVPNTTERAVWIVRNVGGSSGLVGVEVILFVFRFFRDSSTKNHCVRRTNVRNCNQKATGFFALTVGVTSSGFKVTNKKDPIANQRTLEVEEATWA